MTKSKKLVALLVVVAMLFTFVSIIAACGKTHECADPCATCGLCTTQCGEKECEEKCQGHGTPQPGPTPHTCTSKCPTCQKCTNASCQETACKEKCQGHGTPQPGPTPHTCTSKCPTCQKCTNQSCQETACASKCTGHQGQEEPEQPSTPAHVTDKSIDDLVANAPENLKVIYEVVGIWVPTGVATDQYGNGKLIDKSSGKELVIYGMAPTEDAFSYNSETGVYAFTNPKTFQSIKDQFAEGDEIKLGVGYSTQYKNYYSYFISKEESSANITYDVTLTFENTEGTVSLSKSTGLVYNEEVTITIAAAQGYKIGTVKHNDGNVPDNGGYKFNVAIGPNTVAVTFAPADAKVLKDITFDFTAKNGPLWTAAGSTASSTAKQVVVDTITYSFLNCKKGSSATNEYAYLMLCKNEAYFANETAIPGAITSVEITVPSGSSTAAKYYIQISDSAKLEVQSTGTLQTGIGTKAATAEQSDGYSYFNISLADGTVNGQLAKIVIQYWA